eukprot:423303_1
MTRQSNFFRFGRHVMHLMTVIPPACYKCYICGLFGDFQSTSHNNMQRCDGGNYIYGSGWDLDSTPEVFDVNAWTWEKTYVENNCPINGTRRRRLQNSEYSAYIPSNFEYVDPCDSTTAQQIENKCRLARNEQSFCCNIIGNTMCDKLQRICNLDACIAVIGNVTEINIDNQVNELFIQPIQSLCTLPGADMLFDMSNLIETEPILITTTSSPNINSSSNINSTLNIINSSSNIITSSPNIISTHDESSDDDENESDSESDDVLFSGMDIMEDKHNNYNMEDKHNTYAIKVQLTDSVCLGLAIFCVACLVLIMTVYYISKKG